MAYKSGLSLKDDIAEIWTDTTYHDVTIVCADGVELGACRAVLAARCPVFRAMLYGNMKESVSQRVTLHDINSAVLAVVLGFIYTESIDITSVTIAVDVYRAASFLLLPKLMAMVLECVHDISDFGVSSSLLNDAAASIPWSEASEDLYAILRKPFYSRELGIGDLTDLSEEAIHVLFTAPDATTFVTSEYDLLLGIVDWVWAHAEEQGPDVAERRDVLRDVASMAPGCERKIRLGNDSLLLTMTKYLDLTLVCEHRLKSLTEAVDWVTEMSPHSMTFCHHASKNTMCPTGHPSGYRGRQDRQELQWDRSKVGPRVVVSDDCKVVELCMGTSIIERQTARISVPGAMNQAGVCEWDIVVESVGLYGTSHRFSSIGLVAEEFTGFDSTIFGNASAWVFESWQDNIPTITGPNASEMRDYGVNLRNGDVVTFHLDKGNCTCALSVNGVNLGTAWTNLPERVYPAVVLGIQSKYRIKDRF